MISQICSNCKRRFECLATNPATCPGLIFTGNINDIDAVSINYSMENSDFLRFEYKKRVILCASIWYVNRGEPVTRDLFAKENWYPIKMQHERREVI